MSNYAWVCFDCRMSVRRHGRSENVRCPRCAQPCTCLGYKIPIPSRAKRKEWERLKERFYLLRREWARRGHAKRVRAVHDLEREIRRLDALPENEGRVRAIGELRKKLDEARVG